MGIIHDEKWKGTRTRSLVTLPAPVTAPVISQITSTQERSTGRLQDARRTLIATEEIGADVMVDLRNQREVFDLL